MHSTDLPRLHVTNGDSAANGLRAAGLGGEVLVLRDVLSDGPVPALDGAAFHEARASFLGATYGLPLDGVLREYEHADQRIELSAAGGEVVLWFDHELLDQLQLARTLARLAHQPMRLAHLSLVCIDSYPGVQTFVGLGQLAPEQLASLFPSRARVTAAQLALGSTAWNAFTDEDPTALERFLDRATDELPFLAAAMRRHLEEFPSTAGGLPRTERQALEALAAGPATPGALFRAVQDQERWLFMGDWAFWRRLGELAAGAQPLVRIEAQPVAGPGLPGGRVELTEAGRAVLAGAADAVALNGFDRWLGGVHLRAAPGEVLPWRWDPTSERLRARG